jgi:hypothetical protein
VGMRVRGEALAATAAMGALAKTAAMEATDPVQTGVPVAQGGPRAQTVRQETAEMVGTLRGSALTEAPVAVAEVTRPPAEATTVRAARVALAARVAHSARVATGGPAVRAVALAAMVVPVGASAGPVAPAATAAVAMSGTRRAVPVA